MFSELVGSSEHNIRGALRLRREIFAIHLAGRGRDPLEFDLNQLAMKSDGFSGAEIEQVIIASLYDAFDENRDITTEDMLNSIAATVPLSQTMETEITHLRQWGRTHARPASQIEPVVPGINGRSGIRHIELG